MPKLSNVDWIAVNDIIYKLNSAENDVDLRKEFIKSMLGAFTFDAAAFMTADNDPSPELFEMPEKDVEKYSELVKSYASSDSSVKDAKTDGVWEYGLDIPVFCKKTYLGCVCLRRTKALGPFSERDHTIADVILPHLALAMYKLRGPYGVVTQAPDRESLMSNYNLTARESEVLSLLLGAKSNDAICEVMGISPNTLKNHQQNIYRKFNIHNRIELFSMFMN